MVDGWVWPEGMIRSFAYRAPGILLPLAEIPDPVRDEANGLTVSRCRYTAKQAPRRGARPPDKRREYPTNHTYRPAPRLRHGPQNSTNGVPNEPDGRTFDGAYLGGTNRLTEARGQEAFRPLNGIPQPLEPGIHLPKKKKKP